MSGPRFAWCEEAPLDPSLFVEPSESRIHPPGTRGEGAPYFVDDGPFAWFGYADGVGLLSPGLARPDPWGRFEWVDTMTPPAPSTTCQPLPHTDAVPRGARSWTWPFPE